MYNVKEFGAKGDCSVLDTAAIQSAIDAAAENGGGLVYVPAGRYRVRTIKLKSNITLFLETGSVLEADTEFETFRNRATRYGESNELIFVDDGSVVTEEDIPRDNPFEGGLLDLCGVKHVKICGGGMLDGHDVCFVEEKAEMDKHVSGPWANPIMYWAKQVRPYMLSMKDSEYVDVEGITIAHSPTWSGFIENCHHMNFVGMYVQNGGDMPNSDGMHFRSCTYVNLVGCQFICGDDCIAIDSCAGGESHHFTISGCTFDGTVNAFRIFTGLDSQHIPDYPHLNVHDIAASGCSCNCSGVFNLSAMNGDIYNVSMTGFTINTDPERLGNCAFLMTCEGGRIYDCTFSDVTAHHNGAVTIMGEEGYSIHDIDFDNWRMCITPMEKGHGIDMPDPLGKKVWLHHYAPYGMYLRHAKDIRFRNVDMTWGEGGNVKLPLPAIKIDRCENIETEGFRVK